MPNPGQLLRRPQIQSRLILLGLILFFFIYAFFLPQIRPHLDWECWTRQYLGLPCPFCGVTRASHALLLGRWHEVLYFNALAFPLAFVSLLLLLLLSLEIITRRQLLRMPALTPKLLLRGLAILLLLWCLQIHSALSQHKEPLLDHRGLYFRFFP